MQTLANWAGGGLLLAAFLLGWVVMGRIIWLAVAQAPGYFPM